MKKSRRQPEEVGGGIFNARSIMFLQEENERYYNERRNQNGGRPGHVTEERRHGNAVFFRDGFDHKVRRIADIGVGAHENRAAGDGSQYGVGNDAHIRDHASFCAQTNADAKEGQVGRCIIQETRQYS